MPDSTILYLVVFMYNKQLMHTQPSIIILYQQACILYLSVTDWKKLEERFYIARASWHHLHVYVGTIHYTVAHGIKMVVDLRTKTSSSHL